MLIVFWYTMMEAKISVIKTERAARGKNANSQFLCDRLRFQLLFFFFYWIFKKKRRERITVKGNKRNNKWPIATNFKMFFFFHVLNSICYEWKRWDDILRNIIDLSEFFYFNFDEKQQQIRIGRVSFSLIRPINVRSFVSNSGSSNIRFFFSLAKSSIASFSSYFNW